MIQVRVLIRFKCPVVLVLINAQRNIYLFDNCSKKKSRVVHFELSDSFSVKERNHGNGQRKNENREELWDEGRNETMRFLLQLGFFVLFLVLFYTFVNVTTFLRVQASEITRTTHPRLTTFHTLNISLRP